MASGDAGDRQPCALPELVVVDLRDGRSEAALQLRLRGQQLLALALQGAVLGEMELGGEDADPAGAQGATRRESASAPAFRGRCARPRASRRSRARRLP